MKLSLLTAAALAGSALAAVDPIVIKGSKFFYSGNNTQFYIRGVAYQQDVSSGSTNASTYQDPLVDGTACKRDIPLMQELRTNTIRVYAINPEGDHSECMNALADAGIYVISDLSDPSDSIDRSDAQWDTTLYARYTSVVDEMAQYNNTLGFFAGNEVSNTVNTTDASAFVKAAVRDMKSYIKQKNYRSIGVGYATNDDSSIRVNMADYFNCDTTEDGIDFWGYNIYSWCGDSSYQSSGYKDRTEEFQNYSVPVFFAEYGCNAVQPRKFTEVDALYGDNMADVWSGGIVYMYFQEDNDYGLVSVVDSTSVSKLADFTSYSKHIASASPSGTNKASYSPSASLQSCPAVGTSWEAKASPLPPTPNSDLCSCMSASAKCVVKDSVSSSDYSDLFGVVCGYTDCSGVNANGTTGKYGAYSMCEAKDQLNFIINQYYQEEDNASACDFGGSATTTATTKATGTCKSLMSEAGSAGTGTVTSQPTGTSGSGGSSSTTSASQGAAASVMTSSVVVGGSVQFGAYVVTAVLAGLGMILL